MIHLTKSSILYYVLKFKEQRSDISQDATHQAIKSMKEEEL